MKAMGYFTKRNRARGCAWRALALLSMVGPCMCRAQAPPPYTISTFAGTYSTTATCPSTSVGDGGAAASAQLCGPAGLAFDGSGNLYIADSNNERVREVTSSGSISTVAGNGKAGFAGDGSSATASGTELNSPSAVAFDSSGNLYIADSQNYEVRKVAGGAISTVAGHNQSGAGFSGDLGPATGAQFNGPSGLALDSAGNLYISDPFYNEVRVVCANQTPIACTNTAFGSVTFAAGDINTFAGNQVTGAGYQGDGSPATASLLNNPIGLAMDSAGNLYIADTSNNAIRKVAPNGIITTVAGNGNPTGAYSGDGGLATQAQLNSPKAVAVDASGNLYIADTVNCVIRMVEPNGIITTIAGNGVPGYFGDGAAATGANLAFPSGVAVYGGKVYISDSQNNVVRMLTPQAQNNPPKVNAGGVVTASAFGASATVAPGSWIEIYGSNLAPDTRQWQTSDFSGSTAPVALDFTSVTVGQQPAYVAYISPGQVNVQVPNVSAGTQTLVVSNPNGSSAAYNLTVGAAPGLYAPALVNIGGKQYAGAFEASSPNTWVLPAGAVSTLTSQPAKPGDTIILYGVGFGSVTPSIPAGQIASGQTSLTAQVQFMFGSTPATTTYQGLAPGLVGLYQFNVVVPTMAANNAVPLTFTQGGVAGTQTLYTAIGQ